MRRREFFTGIAGSTLTAWPNASSGQQPAKLAKVGYLAVNRTANFYQIEAFLRGMRDLGWIEGRNFTIEIRDADGKPERLPALAAELVALRPDVIVAAPTLGAQAARKATSTIPIVFPISSDPVGSGLVQSLARPGANISGLSLLASDLVGKHLDLLTQIVPGAGLVAILWQPSGHSGSTDSDMLARVRAAARAPGLKLQFVEARGPDEIEKAFAAMGRVRGLIVLPVSLFTQQRARIVQLAAKSRLPAVYPSREFVDAGGLMSYGASIADLFRRSATYVDKVLKGAKPSELAVEQPTKFEMVINLKAAKALRLTIPPIVLAEADEVIE